VWVFRFTMVGPSDNTINRCVIFDHGCCGERLEGCQSRVCGSMVTAAYPVGLVGIGHRPAGNVVK